MQYSMLCIQLLILTAQGQFSHASTKRFLNHRDHIGLRAMEENEIYNHFAQLKTKKINL